MKYMLLIHLGDSEDKFEALSKEEQKAIYGDWKAIHETAGVTSGTRLSAPEEATTVWVEDGKTVRTEGPAGEAKEALSGYLIFEADNLDAAIELATRIPAARMGGLVEVRPLVEH